MQTANELLEELKEHCAVIAWMTAMNIFNQNRGALCDASEIGALIAQKIRAVKIEQFQAEQKRFQNEEA